MCLCGKKIKNTETRKALRNTEKNNLVKLCDLYAYVVKK